MPVHVTLLGDRSITDDPSGAVRTRSSRTVALVAYLALHAGRSHARSRLAGLFWPDSTDGQALTNLRRELHGLRRVLGDQDSVEVSVQTLGWRDTPGVVVDLRAFDAERRRALDAQSAGPAVALTYADGALRHYAGEFLPGLDDDWVLEARADLHRQCAQLYALVCRARRELGDLAGAADAARRLTRLEPLQESGYRTLIEVLAAAGDAAGALRAYRRCASVLERELGISPGPDLRAALALIPGRRPGPATASRPPGPAPDVDPDLNPDVDPDLDPNPDPDVGPAGTVSGTSAAEIALVGRVQEFERLRRAWAGAVAGRARLAVVMGDPGVGKTRLVTELAGLAARAGAVVASSQCFGASGRVALAPVADWLRGSALAAGAARLEPVWRDEVDRLLPSAGARGPAGSLAVSNLPPSATGGSAHSPGRFGRMADAWQRHRFFEGLARALLATGRPTLLTLDNLQWCDQETLAFLTRLFTLAADAPLLVAATLRAGSLDAEPEPREWLGRMRAAGLLDEVALDPLEREDTVRLAEMIGGRAFVPAERDVLYGASSGYPLHVVEAMRALRAGGSATSLPAGDLALVLRGRLEQASPAAREIAGLASAVGRDFSLDLVTEASELDPDAVVSAVDELWRLRILRESAAGFDFTHDLLRDAAYARISPARRWLAHRRLAQGLELLHADDLEPVASELAEQYARAGRPAQAVDYYRRAARGAATVFAHAEAVRLLDAGLAIVRAQPASRDRDQRELDLLETAAGPLNAWRGYASAPVHELIVRTIELAESLGRTDSVLTGLVGLWAAMFVQGQMADCEAAGRRALALAQPGSSFSGAAHFALGGAMMCMGRPVESLPHLTLAVEQARDVSLIMGPRPDLHAAAFEAHAHWLLGEPDTARDRCRDGLARARAVTEAPYNLAMALAYAAVTWQLCGDVEEMLSTVAELDELCRRYGFGYYGEWALVLRGWHLGGRDGLELARRGLANLRAQGALARMPTGWRWSRTCGPGPGRATRPVPPSTRRS